MYSTGVRMKTIISILFALIILACNSEQLLVNAKEQEPKPNEQITAVGARSSHYGFIRDGEYGEVDTFPSPEQFGTILTNQAALYPGAVPASVWIVGGIGDGKCMLEFPAPDSREYPNITFSDDDRHEAYLTHFDSIGVKVYLQVEAGMADMNTLIDLVLTRYGHHSCVAGFGIDIEWYPSPYDAAGKPVGEPDQWGTTNEWAAISDEAVRAFDTKIKEYNSSYRLFLKHWVPEMCGTQAVSDVIYINDTQGYGSLNQLVNEFSLWSKHFFPNEMGFQIGYGSDQTWWEQLNNPIVAIGDAIVEAVPDQKVQLYWVDFTLDHEKMSDLW